MATAICTAAAVVIIMDGAEAAGTITAGAIIASIDTRWMLLSSSHCPNESRHQRYGRSRRAARPVQISRQSDAHQPRPISTAIRIRSEWFFAPSFCLSSEVVLATVL